MPLDRNRSDPNSAPTGDINEALIQETAQLMVDTGLRDAGYTYLNLYVQL